MLVSSPAYPVSRALTEKQNGFSTPNAQARILRQLVTKQLWPTKQRMLTNTERHLDVHRRRHARSHTRAQKEEKRLKTKGLSTTDKQSTT